MIACIDRYVKASGDQSLIERVTPGWFKFRGCLSTNLESNNQSNHPNQTKKLTYPLTYLIVVYQQKYTRLI